MKKHTSINHRLVESAPYRAVDHTFTKKVMSKVNQTSIEPLTERPIKHGFMPVLRTMPTAALVAIIATAMIALGGATYATVKLVESLYKPSVNQHNRTVIDINSLTCPDINGTPNDFTRFEIKKGSGLSAEDAYHTVLAKCEMMQISHDLNKEYNFAFIMSANPLKQLTDTTITITHGEPINQDQTTQLEPNAYFRDRNGLIKKTDLKPGDTVAIMYGDPTDGEVSAKGVVKLSGQAKYYGQYQEYIRPIKQCKNNPGMDCAVASNINHTILVLDYGGHEFDHLKFDEYKEMQGKVVAWDNTSFTLENNGHKLRFLTAYNVIDTYNTTGVYKLKTMDYVYAATNPEDLKVKVGDTLGISSYWQNDGQTEIPWDQIGTIELMVERIPNNLDYLQKY